MGVFLDIFSFAMVVLVLVGVIVYLLFEFADWLDERRDAGKFDPLEMVEADVRRRYRKRQVVRQLRDTARGAHQARDRESM